MQKLQIAITKKRTSRTPRTSAAHPAHYASTAHGEIWDLGRNKSSRSISNYKSSDSIEKRI